MPAAVNNRDVRWHLGRLLSQAESLRDFAEWFIDAQWSIELDGSDEDVELAARIENRFGAYSSGYISEDELVADLRGDAAEFGVAVPPRASRPRMLATPPRA